MKKYKNFEDELDAIRKEIQKERKKMGTKAWTTKINKEAEELAKEYGFNFKVDKNKSEYDIPAQKPLFINEDTPEDKGKRNENL